jgi:mRNA interferase HigB
MLIVYLDRLREFGKKHPDARKSISTWKSVVENLQWKKKQDVLFDFPKAKILANNRARFEIVHNKYRLIIQIDYLTSIVQIRFIGTHEQYDRINPEII